MRKVFILLKVWTCAVLMNMVSSCGNSGAPQVDGQSLKDSLKKAIIDSIKSQTTSAESVSTPFVGKVYKGSGNGGGLYTEMEISFLDNNKCICKSDWYQAYSEKKELQGTYEVKGKQVIVRYKDKDIYGEFEFEVKNDGKVIEFNHSDPEMGGSMGNDFMSLELQSTGTQIRNAQTEKATPNEVNNQSSMPTVQKIGNLFDDMAEGKSTALTDYGFTLVDKQTQTFQSEYDEYDDTEYEMVKEVYTLKYEIIENGAISEGHMRAIYISAKDYGMPEMTIECDSNSWELLLAQAESSLKKISNRHYFLNIYSFIGFEKKGVITITTENSVSW